MLQGVLDARKLRANGHQFAGANNRKQPRW